MSTQRKHHSAEFKTRVASEAIRGAETLNQLSVKFDVHSNQIARWKQEAIELIREGFNQRKDKRLKKEEELKDELFRQIVQLKVELDWIKKNLDFPTEIKKTWIEKNNPYISIDRQCKICGLARSGYYYQPKGESPYNLILMELIDKEFIRHPFYGYRRMTKFLQKKGYKVNSKRIRRLMDLMGLEAVFPGRKTTITDKDHKKYPYLLKGLEISRPDQGWAMDITYIRIKGGFIYLTAIMDWYSRYVLAWDISNTLDSLFCVDALKKALTIGIPEIINTDQGV